MSNMFTESFITGIRAQHKTANTAIAKDVGLYLHNLYPTHAIKATYKKSSAYANCVVVNTTHIFAAQADKAHLHVYSRERGNQEALIAFPERIHSLALVNDGLLALGTAEGRIILWEVCTGRQVSTPTSHLQAVTCLASTGHHLVSGSEDSNVHVWSIPTLMSTATEGTIESLRSLSNHRAAITSLTMGHSSARTNICISTSKDNTAIVWNYQTGTLLRTFLLPSTPLCLALDPCDRAIYIGLENGEIQPIDLIDPRATQNTLYDESLQATPVQAKSPSFTGATEGAIHCLDLNFDGTILLSGHESGKLLQWDVGPKAFLSELADLNAPVTNLKLLSPFPSRASKTKSVQVVKPKMGDVSKNYEYQSQFIGEAGDDKWRRKFEVDGFSDELLEEVLLSIETTPEQIGGGNESALNDKLKKENEDLWKMVNEQRALQKRTFDKIK